MRKGILAGVYGLTVAPAGKAGANSSRDGHGRAVGVESGGRCRGAGPGRSVLAGVGPNETPLHRENRLAVRLELGRVCSAQVKPLPLRYEERQDLLDCIDRAVPVLRRSHSPSASLRLSVRIVTNRTDGNAR